jgi:hypothetical protein
MRPDGTPFYVGKGSGNRYLLCGGKNAHARAVVKQIVDSEQKIGLCIIDSDSEEAAFAEEVRLIALYGRRDLGTGTLCNFTDGGEGGGREQAVRRAISTWKNMSPEMRAQRTARMRSTTTKEQRKQRGIKGGKKLMNSLTPQQRSEKSRQVNAGLSQEQKFERSRKAGLATRGPDKFSMDNIPAPKEKK